MTDFKVTESGWYRTRDGRDAEVVVTPANETYPVVGYIVGVNSRFSWAKSGAVNLSFPLPEKDLKDLVEYLGKERPKQKKVVRMAPTLVLTGKPDYKISHFLFKSEDEAKELYAGDFVRWLIDTHAVEVEVEG